MQSNPAQSFICNAQFVIHNPYVGPRAFETADRPNFYGRDVEIRQMTDLVIAQRAVLLYAPSGAGKTSLVNAGIVPALGRRRMTVLPVARVGGAAPPETRNPFVYNALAALLGEAADPHMLLELSLLDGLKLVAPQLTETGVWLLIVDQFEELFTQYPGRRAAREDFFTQLQAALDAAPHLGLLLAMREEYLAYLDSFSAMLPDRLRSRFRLDLLTAAAARAAIQSPARAQGVEFTDAAAQKLLDDLRQVQEQGLDGATEIHMGQYVEPVQLQVVCRQVWERVIGTPADDEQRSAISGQPSAGGGEWTAIIQETDVEAVGDVDVALGAYYAQSVTRSANATGRRERAIREWVEQHLITPQGLRGIVLRQAEQSGGLDNAVIAELENAHLVRAENRAGATWYELAHDRLVSPVRRDNAAWFEQNLSPFQRQALRWHSERRSASLLLRDQELDAAEQWAAGHTDAVTAVERDFLNVSRSEQTRREQAQTLRAEHRLNLEDLGWGVIFAHNADPALRAALAELLDHRRAQAGSKRADYYHEFSGAEGYRPDDTAQKFLTRHKGALWLGNPERVPYYLLIVGDPETIPFEFQYGLEVQYAVGRLHFETLEEYASYARSVVTVETEGLSLPRRAALFGTQHPGDNATKITSRYFLKPLLQQLQLACPDWDIHPFFAEQATKACVANLLSGTDVPALLFTAAHGISFGKEHVDQVQHQGALLCQDWPGEGRIFSEHYFTADDVTDDARLLGLVAFLWGENMAGTPKMDNFAYQTSKRAQPIAENNFIARLPQRLLSHPLGGALAIIGHVDNIWGYSFLDTDGNPTFVTFANLLERLMRGYTVGAAMDLLNQRYASLSAQLSEMLLHQLSEEGSLHLHNFNTGLASLITATIDMRNYILLGDPAVHLPISPASVVSERLTISPAEVLKLLALHLVEQGQVSAKKGDVEAAIALFRQALEYDSSFIPDPEAETRKLDALASIVQWQKAAQGGDISIR